MWIIIVDGVDSGYSISAKNRNDAIHAAISYLQSCRWPQWTTVEVEPW